MTTYVSIDVESLGFAAGLNSMISLGAVAFVDGEEISAFSKNIQEREEFSRVEKTMEWWSNRPGLLEMAQKNAVPAEKAMVDFVEWVNSLPKPRVAVAWPATFDFAFLNYYCLRFAGSNPLGFAALDMRSLAMGITGSENYEGFTEQDLYDLTSLENENPLHHVAVNDAREQGRLFCALQNLSHQVSRKWAGKLYTKDSDIENELIADILVGDSQLPERIGQLYFGDRGFLKIITKSLPVFEPVVIDNGRRQFIVHLREKDEKYFVYEEYRKVNSDKSEFYTGVRAFGSNLQEAIAAANACIADHEEVKRSLPRFNSDEVEL